MDFSQWLQAEMKRLDLTNYRLAKISSVHQTTISNILNGKKPQIETERKIRDAISEICSNLPEKKENPAPDWDGLSGKDKRLIEWFRSLPLEKQKAILISQDGPTDAV